MHLTCFFVVDFVKEQRNLLLLCAVLTVEWRLAESDVILQS